MPLLDSNNALPESPANPPTALIVREETDDLDTICEGCDATIIDGRNCITCVICERCNVVSNPERTIATARGHRICHRCRDEAYVRCADCSEWNRDDVSCGNGCQDSYDDEDDVDDEDGVVHDYNYKPNPLFHGSGPLYLGAEIEVATQWNDYSITGFAQQELGPLGYLKEDSSIGGGFEIVTHPMSYDWALEHFPWRMLTRLHELGCATTDSTGLHVHLSRAGFSSPCHIYRWMKFIYRNERPVSGLARRRSDEWAAFRNEDRRRVKAYAKGDSGERYRAINTNNVDTFELRRSSCKGHRSRTHRIEPVRPDRGVLTPGGWDCLTSVSR